MAKKRKASTKTEAESVYKLIEFPSPKKREQFVNHVDQWTNCNRCNLHQNAFRKVLYRGTVPCDYLFIGEAPGRSEDAVGYPFVGPAGKILDRLISQCQEQTGVDFTYGISNVVACLPLDIHENLRSITDLGHAKIRVPEREECLACAPRLTQMIQIARPKYGTIMLGKVAETKAKSAFIASGIDVPVLPLYHPAYLLRMGDRNEGKSVAYAKTALQLKKFVEETHHA